MKLKKLLCLIIIFTMILALMPVVADWWDMPVPNGFDVIRLTHGTYGRIFDTNAIPHPTGMWFVDGRVGFAQRETYLRFEFADYAERILKGEEELRLQLTISHVIFQYPTGAYILPPHLAEFDPFTLRGSNVINETRPPSNTSMRNDFSRLAVTFMPAQSGVLLTDDFAPVVREFLLAYPDETGITLRISSLCLDPGQTTDGSAIFSFIGRRGAPSDPREPVLLIGSELPPPPPPVPDGFDAIRMEYGARATMEHNTHHGAVPFFVDGRPTGAHRDTYLRFELDNYIERILAGEELKLQLNIMEAVSVGRYPAGAYILPPHLAEFGHFWGFIPVGTVTATRPPSYTSMRNDFSRLAATFTPTQTGALLTDDFAPAVRDFLLTYPEETGITLRISSLCRDPGHPTDGSAIFSFSFGTSIAFPSEPVLLIGFKPPPPEHCDECGEYDCDGDCEVEPPPEPCADCGEYDCDGDCGDVPSPPNALQITPSPVNFGTIQQGRPNPGAIPITITNTSDVELTLNPLPSVIGFTFGNLPNPVLQPEQSRTISVNVNANLPVGTHNTTATITTVEGASATVELRFVVTAPQNNNNNNNNNNQGTWNNNRPSGNIFTRPPLSNNQNNNAPTPMPQQFTDVSPSDWFAPYVLQAVSSGLLNGVGNGEFAPNAATTRAMFVTVLWRLAGSPNGYNGGDFSDVANDSWYSQAIAWAAANGIVSGVGNGYFAPNTNITREQMGIILYRYIGDAVDAVMDRNYVPQNTATRAEMAAVMLRLLEI